jgi:hypothetical protein
MPVGAEFYSSFVSQSKEGEEIKYDITNKEKFAKFLQNKISYYRGAQPQSFPKTIFNVVRCKMEPFQYKSYRTIMDEETKGNFMGNDILKLPTNFMLGPRMISNIAFPNKKIGEKGFASFSGSNLKKNNITKYSKKFYKILNKVNKAEGPTFIYSNFKDLGGIRSMVQYLEYYGYKNYNTFSRL